MKTLTFTYTKADGSTSERTLLALVTPGGDKFAGIDLSSLEPERAREFVEVAQDLYENYISSLTTLQAEFDLRHNYRQFNESGVSDLVEI